MKSSICKHLFLPVTVAGFNASRLQLGADGKYPIFHTKPMNNQWGKRSTCDMIFETMPINSYIDGMVYNSEWII